MKRYMRLLAVLMALALVAAACGDDGEEAEPGDTDGTTEPADLSGESIEVAAVWSGGEQENFEAVLAAFEEETGADVTFTSTGDDIAAVLGTAIEGGEPPDVAMLPQPGLLADLADQGALVDVEDVAGDEVDANYASIWRDLGTVDDTLYGVWFKAANKSTFWYNTGVLDSAGVEAPETWDDLMAGAQTVLDSGVTPISVGGADGWTLTDWFENVYIRTAGADMYDQLTDHEIPWTDESVITALDTMGELLTDEFVVGGTDGALQTDFPTSVTQVFVDPPDGAMVYEGDFVAGVINDETDAVVGEDADFFPFPSIDDSPAAVIGGGDVAVLLDDTPGGRALVEWLATPAPAEIWAAAGGFISPNEAVDTAVYPDAISQATAEALIAAGDNFRFDLSDLQPSEFGATVGQGLFKLFQDWLADPSASADIAQQMEDEASAAFGG